MIKVVNLRDLSEKDYQAVMRRAGGNFQAVLPAVKLIMEDVKKNGDKALIKYFRQFTSKAAPYSIKVTQEEIKQAYREVSNEFIKSIKQMIKNITAVQKAQLKTLKEAAVSPERGIRVWREWRAIEKVGIYVPGGKAIYPSSVLMTAIPAQIAGCKKILMCSPAKENGKIPPATLVAADLVGVKEIYKVGGAEAVAAMTFGTETVPPVYKIYGAGNSYVTAAKVLALNSINIDMPAGPSEVFIIADENANPKFIASDLLADGEHGFDSACVLVTTSRKVALETAREIDKQLSSLSTKDRVVESLRKYGLIAIAKNLDEALKFSNEYAPEHLEIMVKNPESLVKKITNAGSVFLGDYTAKATGDYATGANHVLPTGGFAKMYPPLGVDSFGKWMQVQECSKEGLAQIKESVETVAKVEKLPAHAISVSIRFK